MAPSDGLPLPERVSCTPGGRQIKVIIRKSIAWITADRCEWRVSKADGGRRSSPVTGWGPSLEKSQRAFHSLRFKSDLSSPLTLPRLVSSSLGKKNPRNRAVKKRESWALKLKTQQVAKCHKIQLPSKQRSLKALLWQFKTSFAKAKLFNSSDPKRAVTVLILCTPEHCKGIFFPASPQFWM